MIEPKITKPDENENGKSLKVFAITTAIGKWHFGSMEAAEYVIWCQSFRKYCKSVSVTRKQQQRRGTASFSMTNLSVDIAPNIMSKFFSASHQSNGDNKESDGTPEMVPRVMMNVEEDLIPINDETEDEEDSVDSDETSEERKGLSTEAMKKIFFKVDMPLKHPVI